MPGKKRDGEVVSAIGATQTSTIRPAMTTLNSRLQLAMLNRRKGRSALEKGFTLVELMIVIVIVGILSAVALPNFLNQTSKAKGTECTTKGGTIMGLVAADALQSTETGSDTMEALVNAENDNSDFCTFTMGNAGDPTAGGVYTLEATGKGELTDEYDGKFCVNYKTGKKGQATTNTGTAPEAPDCEA
tara:strand:+ start:139 stop:702 length:564 start_codon:yes stop_codon:yes gene_type:complete